MTPLFLLRLVLDFSAVSLLIATFLYDWAGNALHEIAGIAVFLLLGVHNIFNRRWWARLGKTRVPKSTLMVNLAVFAAMLALLVTSVIISQTVFAFLSFRTSFTARQLHTLFAYVALMAAAVHLGLHWSMITGVMRNRFGIEAGSAVRTATLRVFAACLSMAGLNAVLALDLATKLSMRIPMGFDDFDMSTSAAVFHHFALVGLFATVAHYTLKVGKAAKVAVKR